MSRGTCREGSSAAPDIPHRFSIGHGLSTRDRYSFTRNECPSQDQKTAAGIQFVAPNQWVNQTRFTIPAFTPAVGGEWKLCYYFGSEYLTRPVWQTALNITVLGDGGPPIVIPTNSSPSPSPSPIAPVCAARRTRQPSLLVMCVWGGGPADPPPPPKKSALKKPPLGRAPPPPVWGVPLATGVALLCLDPSQSSETGTLSAQPAKGKEG